MCITKIEKDMKRILLIATLILVTIAGVKAQDVFTSFSARIGNLSVNYNNSQVSDLLYQHYGVPVNTLNSLYNSYDRNWGDVTMALEMSNHFNIPVSRIHTCYAKNKGKGWGVIAKDLNIKPGSYKFKRLKSSMSKKETYWQGVYRDYSTNRNSNIARKGKVKMKETLYSDFSNSKGSHHNDMPGNKNKQKSNKNKGNKK